MGTIHNYGDETLDKSDRKAKGECKACGRTDHKRNTHRNCPFNKAKRVTDSKVKVMDSSSVQPKSRSKIKDVTDSEVPFKVTYIEEFAKVEEYITVQSEQNTDCSSFTNDSESTMSEDNISFLEDFVTEVCVCECLTRAHKAFCPMNSRNRYKNGSSTKQIESTLNLKIGNYVALHHQCLPNIHLVCRVVEKCKNKFRLYCRVGLLSGVFLEQELVVLGPPESDKEILLDRWRQTPVLNPQNAIKENSESCFCVFPSKKVFDLTAIPHQSSVSEVGNWLTMTCIH